MRWYVASGRLYPILPILILKSYYNLVQYLLPQIQLIN